MENRNSLEYFANMAKSNPDEKSVKINKFNDFTDIDAAFIAKYIDEDTELLDLASGTGMIVNKLYNKVKKITAVELFQEFTKFIVKAPNVEIINEDIVGFKPTQTYDVITMFGVVQYFNEEEVKPLYKKYIEVLTNKGKLIVKSQFGQKEDVTVSGYSNELKSQYYSQYRHIQKEMDILKAIGFKNIQAFDIYPPECNRWENTHFYAIVAEK